MFYVYEHIRNDTNKVFYVGKGSGKRAFNTRGRSEYWKRVVNKANGFTVRIVKDSLEEELAFLVEVERIDQLKRLGVILVNSTIGGEGASGCVRSEETKQKISNLHKGKPKSEEHRKKLSEAKKGSKNPNFGKPKTKDIKEKISKSNTGKKMSESTKEKLSKANKGKTLSLEHRQKMSDSHKKRIESKKLKERDDL